ncbi:MAG: cell division topological specificity factor MinE [Bacillota bacterium]
MFSWFRRKRADAGFGSREQAKKRLAIVLVHDRAEIAGDLVTLLRERLRGVLEEFVELADELKVEMNTAEGAAILTCAARIKQLRRRSSLEMVG